MLTYSLGSQTAFELPAWLGIDAISGQLSGTPANDDIGTISVNVIATDSAGETATSQLRITVAAIGGAPSGGDKTIIAVEDKSISLTPADFGFTDMDGDNFAAVIIDSLTVHGTLTLNGVAIVPEQEIASADLGRLAFISARDGFGNDYDSFSFRVKDDGGTADGHDTDQSANTISFDVSDFVDYRNGTKRNNILVGDDGRDILRGRAGNDTLTGGAGIDTFVFRTQGDRDRIRDFDAIGTDHDILDIRNLHPVTNYNDLKKNHMKQVGGDVVIDGLNGDMITLRGVKLGDLDKGDFWI